MEIGHELVGFRTRVCHHKTADPFLAELAGTKRNPWIDLLDCQGWIGGAMKPRGDRKWIDDLLDCRDWGESVMIRGDWTWIDRFAYQALPSQLQINNNNGINEH